MGMLRAAIAILLIVLMFFSAFWVYEQISYSWKMNKDMEGNNATCYFDRGLFNFPLAKVCTYNKTIVIERKGGIPK